MSRHDLHALLRLARTYLRKRTRRAGLRAAAPRSELHIATGAVLLEVLDAGSEPTRDQRHHLETVLGKQLGLATGAGRLLLHEAERVRETRGIHACIRLVAESYSALQKVQLVRMMDDVIHLDGIVTRGEEYVMRKLGILLRIDRALVEARERRASSGT
jgi:uncharacterized tellurite resistance protein B-like protein